MLQQMAKFHSFYNSIIFHCVCVSTPTYTHTHTHTHTLLYKTFIHSPAAAKSLQSCLTLCDPIDGSPPGSPVPGILQARTLEWVAISFSNAWKWKAKVKSLSRVRPSATTWTAAHQALPSIGVSRQEYWSGVPFPSPIHSPADRLNGFLHILAIINNAAINFGVHKTFLNYCFVFCRYIHSNGISG